MPQTVLVVDDDLHTRILFSTALLERGYSVVTAENGAEGVHLARRTRPAMILLDLRMPVMDGFQALRYLKSYAETRSIPVCAMTAYEIRDEDRQIVQLPECLIQKPVSGRAVVSEVEARIGPPRHRGPGPVGSGPIPVS